jgi:hypothetical protein
VLNISREGSWPLTFLAQIVQDRTTLFCYTPRSDYLFSVNTCPLVLIENESQANGSDRIRMLLQAGLLVRVVNRVGPGNQSFVVMCLYLRRQSTAERYFVYQPDTGQQSVGIPNSSIADHSS